MQKLVFAHPWAISVTFLSFVLVSGAPIYCGWRMLDRRADKKPLATNLIDKIFGGGTMCLGGLYGLLYAYSVGSTFHDPIRSWIAGDSQSLLNWAAILGVGLPFFIVIVSILWGVIFCGANLCATRPLVPQAWLKWTFLSDQAGRQVFMGTCSLIIGLVGFILVFADFVAWTNFGAQ